MDRTKLLCVLSIVLVLSSMLVVSSTEAATCWSYSRAERGFARRINRARGARGLPRLTLDKQLSRVSRFHTTEMLKRRTLFHTSMTTLGRRVTRWVVLAENIGYARSTRRVFRAMMASSLHRANILMSAIRYVGVGTHRRNGRLWVTMTFEARRDPGTTMSMPNC